MHSTSDALVARFHNEGDIQPAKGEYNEHFWRGYGSFGRNSGFGCGCGICQHGWKTARNAFTELAKGYGQGERQHRQLDLLP